MLSGEVVPDPSRVSDPTGYAAHLTALVPPPATEIRPGGCGLVGETTVFWGRRGLADETTATQPKPALFSEGANCRTEVARPGGCGLVGETTVFWGRCGLADETAATPLQAFRQSRPTANGL